MLNPEEIPNMNVGDLLYYGDEEEYEAAHRNIYLIISRDESKDEVRWEVVESSCGNLGVKGKSSKADFKGYKRIEQWTCMVCSAKMREVDYLCSECR